jgi:hypothetical protein
MKGRDTNGHDKDISSSRDVKGMRPIPKGPCPGEQVLKKEGSPGRARRGGPGRARRGVQAGLGGGSRQG